MSKLASTLKIKSFRTITRTYRTIWGQKCHYTKYESLLDIWDNFHFLTIFGGNEITGFANDYFSDKSALLGNVAFDS